MDIKKLIKLWEEYKKDNPGDAIFEYFMQWLKEKSNKESEE